MVKRQAQREAGKKPQGKDPEPPQGGPKDRDQVNLTDEDSRIMPVSGEGFEQSYNAQAGVDTQTMLVVTAHVSQACNDKREVQPTRQAIEALPNVLGHVQTLIADNGYYSGSNAHVCAAGGVRGQKSVKIHSNRLDKGLHAGASGEFPGGCRPSGGGNRITLDGWLSLCSSPTGSWYGLTCQ